MPFARSPRPLTLMALIALVALSAGCALPVTLGKTAPTATPTPAFTLSGGGSCVTLGAKPTPPFVNERVSQDTFLAHSEPEIAEDPTNPLHLVGGSKFFTNPGQYLFQIGTYVSFDGGCVWTDNGVLPGFASGEITSDISFAFGPAGQVYAVTLDTDNNNQSGLSLSTSTDGGRTYGPPVHLLDITNGAVFNDKPWVTVDLTQGPRRGAIYVAWSYDDNAGACATASVLACSQHLGFTSSTDGGKTFAPARSVEGSAPFCANPTLDKPAGATTCDAALGATPAVLPDGTLAVAYAYVDLGNGTHPTRMIVQTSRDGGATWNTPTLVAQIHDIPSPFPGERYRNFALPAFVADPTSQRLYLAWPDEHNNQANIEFASSADSGVTWGPPVTVNDDPTVVANHFQPQLAVAPDGVVSVSFFDTRNDPTGKLIDVYLAQSTDHGASFLKNSRVTTVSWDPTVDAPRDSSGNAFIGDYQGLAADNLFVHPFWNDTRSGAQEIFTAAVPSVLPPVHQGG